MLVGARKIFDYIQRYRKLMDERFQRLQIQQ